MKLPRDLSAESRSKAEAFGLQGFTTNRQPHRLTSTQKGEHHITIPNHNPLRVGILSAILADIGVHFSLTREECIQKLFA
jgi:hypothetical protein